MSLLDIPDLPMIKILENCDFMSLLCLRKTCHNLREFIDCLAPETDIVHISVAVYIEFVEMRLILDPKTPLLDLNITYNKCSQGCKLEIFEYRSRKDHSHYNRWKKATKYIADADFMDVFCTDLSAILRMQGSKMNDLNFCVSNMRKTEPKKGFFKLLSYLGCFFESSSEPEFIDDEPEKIKDRISNQIYDMIKISLQSRLRPLRIGRLGFDVTSKRQFLQVLQYTDPTVLDNLFVTCYPKKIDLEIDDLKKMSHWKNIKDLCIWGFVLKGGSIEDFGHLKTGSIHFEVVTVNDVLFLKEVSGS
ncbi:unnamed protein product [Caenorhabditis brenneri]